MQSHIPVKAEHDFSHVSPSDKPIVKEKVSACFLCAGYCGVIISLDEDDKVVKVVGDKNNANSQGFICNKGVNLFSLLDNPDRLTQPLKRAGGKLQPISWDQALREIGEKLKALRKKNGARAIGLSTGGAECQSTEALLASMLIGGLGSLNAFNPAGLEFLARFLVSQNMYGVTMMDGYPDIEHGRYIIIIGANPLVSCPPKGPALKAVGKDPDRTLVVIDPRYTETARIADHYLPINIATDVYFLAAMAHVIIHETLYDADFVAKHTTGVAQLAEAVKPFTPRIAEQHCQIKAEVIIQIARDYARASGGVLYYHMGVIANHHATLVAWLVQSIKVITNNKGKKGGSLINPILVDMNLAFTAAEKAGRYSSRTRPGLGHIASTLPTTLLADEILTPGKGQIKAMIVSCCNPIKGYGDSIRMEEAFDSLELLVSIDPFLTEVGRKADYILPNCAFQEQENLFFTHPWLFKHEFVQVLQKIREPLGQSWPEWKIYRELLRQTGPQGIANRIQHWLINGFEYWHKLKHQSGAFNQQMGLIKLLVRLGGVKWQQALETPGGLIPKRKKPYNYLDKLATKDKKVQLAPLIFTAALLPLSTATAARDKRFPLMLSTLCRSKGNTNTLFKNAAWLKKNNRENHLKIHTTDANNNGIRDRDTIRIISATSSLKVTAFVTEDVTPGSVHLSHGWGLSTRDSKASSNISHGVCANQLVASTAYDALTGMPIFSGVPCRIEPVD